MLTKVSVLCYTYYIIGAERESEEMGNSLSFQAGTRGKMTSKNRAVMISHTYRKSLDIDTKHSNENIDKDKTEDNYDFVLLKDEDGHQMTMDEAIDHKIKTDYQGKRKIRSDAVLVREVVVQPDPRIFDGLSEDEKRQKAIDFTLDSIAFMEKEFNVTEKQDDGSYKTIRDNVLGGSLHLDEKNPHAHIAIMPITKDGRLSQKDFFTGPQDMRMKHERYRSFMNERGWDFDLENKYENAEHVKTEAFKKNAKQIEADRQAYTDEIRRAKHKPDVREEAKRELKDELRDEVYEEAYQEALQNANNRVLSDFNAKREKELEEREKALKLDRNDFNEVIDEYQERITKYNETLAKFREEKEKLTRREKAVEAKRLQYAKAFNESMHDVALSMPRLNGELTNRTKTMLDNNHEPTPQNIRGTVLLMSKNAIYNNRETQRMINQKIGEHNKASRQAPRQQDEGIEL